LLPGATRAGRADRLHSTAGDMATLRHTAGLRRAFAA